MFSKSTLSKETPDKEEIPFSFRDFIPRIKVTKGNDKHIHASTYVKRRFDKYLKSNGAHSQSHAVHMLIEENKILRQICRKVAMGINRAEEEKNTNFLIRIFDDLANPKEKQYYHAILKGCFD